MKAWLLDDFRGLDALRIGEIKRPDPGPQEVLIRLRFAALNPADRFLAEKLYPAKPDLPHILGRDGMGTVEAVGPTATRFKPGDRVLILRGDAGVSKPGTLAEFVCVPEEAVAPAPAGWSDEQAAAGPLVFLTAYQALTQWGDVAKGTVLVTGISGGVGLATLQLAKTFGHKVIGTTRGTAKVERLRQLGPDLLIDPNDPSFRDKVKECTGRKGVDLAVDNVAGELFNTLMDVLGYGGRVSVVGMLGGLVPQFNTAKLLFKRIKVGGVLVSDYQGAQAQEIWSDIVRRLDAAGQRPIVDSEFPFTHLREAFSKLERGPMGKVLVRITP